MLVKSLEQMESLVDSSKTLSWDGWTVVSRKPIENGLMLKDSVLIDGQWFLQKRFDANQDGWNIPKTLVG